jgi:hypothetical protein
LTGTFGGDTSVSPVLLASNGSNSFVVTPDPTAITYTGATTATDGQAATLSGVLTTNGNALPNKTVTLTLGSGGSAQSCSATTDSNGSASCAIASVNQPFGSVPVTASFVGDNYYLASSAASTVVVSPPPPLPTTLTVNAGTGEYNVATTVSGVLTNSNTSAPISGEPVTLTLDGNENCTAITNGTGTASCSITPGEAKGTYPLTGSFAGDTTVSPNWLSSNGANTFVVTPDPTAITYTGATTATNGQPATLSGVLTSFGNPLANKTVTLTLGSGISAQTCSATTNGSGSASCVIASVNQTVGSVPVTASFAGDNYYLASSAASNVAVSPPPPLPTTLTVHSATGEFGFATTVSGVLTNSNTSAPISGEPVTLTLNGAENCTGITDSSGTASCSITPGEAKGTYPLTGTFGGDTSVSPVLLASNGSNSFVVTPDPTAITYTGATTATNGQPATLSGVLSTNGTALPGKTVTLTLGSGGSAQSCSATTNASGSASCAIASVNQTVGSVPVTATFAGDNYYLGSTTSSNVAVIAPPVPTTLTVNAATGEYSFATTVSGVLTNSNTSAPISGEPVTLTLDGNENCTAITNSTGTASCSVTPGEAKGTYPLTGTFAGDTTQVPPILASNGSNTFVVTPDPTAIIYTGTTSVVNGQPATLSGILTTNGHALPNKTVTLTLGSGSSAQTCSATTNISGSANCVIASVSQTAGSIPVTAAFAGDNYYLSSSASSTAGVGTPTTLQVNAATGEYNVATTVSGVLTNSISGVPISGEPVTLTLNGAETCMGTTNSTGTASCSITPGEAKGTYPLTGTFAGDTSASPVLLASNGSNNFVVTPDPTAITYTGATTATNGQPATLSGVLSTNGTALPNKTVTLTLGSGSSAQSCSATTSSTGSASCVIASVSQTVGSVPVTASFAGDNYYLASSASSTVVVSAPPAPTTLKVNAATGEYNVATTVSAVLTNSNTSAPISSEPVTLQLNATQTCTGITNSTGTVSCSVTPNEPQGSYPLTGSFGGDTTTSPILLASTGSNTFVVTPDPTAIVYNGATTATNGQSATLSGTLTAFGSALPGKTVTLTLGSGSTAQTCTATTSSTGSASCVIASVSQTVGSVPVTASFAGDNYYLASSASSTVVVSPPPPVPTTLKVNSATSEYNVATTVSAVLTNSNTSAPISGEPVTLQLNATQTCMGTTNSAGTASCSITPNEPQGSYPLTGNFAGDTTVTPNWLASNGSNTFVVTPDPTAITYTGATTATNGQPATLSGTLTAFGTALPNKTVTLTLGSGSTAQTCSATTSSTGSASCVIASVSQTVGSVPVTATFAGDNYYLGSAASSTVVVSPPAPIPTTLKVNSTTGEYNMATTVSAVLTNSNTSAPISGEPVTLQLNATQTCTGTTNSTGTASCSVTPNEPQGSYPLTGSFAGDTSVSPVLLSSTGSNTFVVTPDPTAMTYTGATTATNGQPATLSGVLTTNGTPLANEPVTLTLGSGSTAQTCSATTSSTGSASCVIASVNQAVCTVPVTASFAGNSYYTASSASSSVKVSAPAPIPTTLKVNSATSEYNVATTVSAVLTNSNTSAPISGEPVTLTLNATQTCMGTTNSAGTASCSVTPGEAPGSYPLTGSFAGDTSVSPVLLSSTGSNTFVVTPDPTAMTYTGATTATNGQPATLSGVLTTNGTPLANEPVTLTLGSGSTAQTCSATTSSTGSASCVIASVNQAVCTVPVTASFAGNTYYLASSASSSVKVSAPPAIPTTLKVNSTTGEYNMATTVSAVLTNSNTSAPISGEPVTIKLNGSQSCTATTNSTGTASCSITPTEAPASYPLTGTFAGDTTVNPNLLASTGSNTFVVTPDPTAITYTGATTAVSGQSATLSGVLTTNGTPLSGQTVLFTLGSGKTVQTCSGTTSSTGSASCVITSVNQTTGSVPVTAAFAGTTYYLSSSASATLIVGVLTTLKVNAATGPYGQPTTVSALLTNTNTSAAIAGEPVTLTLDGNETCTGTTNSTGTASCSITPSEPAGSYPLTGTFAGDTTRSLALFGSNGANTFVVTLAPTDLTYTGSTAFVDGQPGTLSGVLTTNGAPLANEPVTLTLGSGRTAQSCSGTTNSAGSASCVISSVNQTATMCMGSFPISGSFAGNAYYAPSSASADGTLASPSNSGAFVIGDNSAGSPTMGNNVTFWGSSWTSSNSFSGGTPPSSLKGYVNYSGALTCGSTWSSSTSSLSSPPSSTPSEMEVIVSSKATQSGSTVSGTILHIVIVQVDSGYNSSSTRGAGSGEIVGTIC